MFDLLPFLFDLLLEDLHLVLILLDEVFDLILVEVLQFHEAGFLLLGLEQLLLHALDLSRREVTWLLRRLFSSMVNLV